MSGLRMLTFSLIMMVLSGIAIAQAPDQRPPSLAPMLQKILPAIVSIAAHGRAPDDPDPLLSDPHVRRFFGLPQEQIPGDHEFWAAGSGVVTDARQGLLLTSRHVVDQADDITVVLADGRRLPATVVGADDATDLTLIRVAQSTLGEPTFGDSDQLQVGDYVVAVGNPFALGQTVTLGIVSALRKNAPDEDLIQTDASINPGNSGGALVTLKGEIVGINSMIFAPSGNNSGIGFAVPINVARATVRKIINEERKALP